MLQVEHAWNEALLSLNPGSGAAPPCAVRGGTTYLWERLGIAEQHFVEWHGKPVASVKTAFRTAVRLAQLSTEDGNITPHTLRHTAATWLMQNGAPMWDAAGFLGMSEKIRRDVYGHHTQNTYESLLLRLPGQGNRWPRSPRHRGS